MTSEELLAPAVSETELLRRQLLQAQRLSSVGELASSVAHEFNNILTTIINYAKLGMRGNLEPAQKQAFEKIMSGASAPRPSLAACSASPATNRRVARQPTSLN